MNMNNEFRFLMYKSETEDVTANVIIGDETIWMTQKAMSDLFQVTIPTINVHIKNILAEGELVEDSVIRNFLMAAPLGPQIYCSCRNFRTLSNQFCAFAE